MFNNAASRDENTRIISAHIHDHQQYTSATYNAHCMRLAAGGWWPALPSLGWMTTAYTGAPFSESLGRYGYDFSIFCQSLHHFVVTYYKIYSSEAETPLSPYYNSWM